MKRGLLIFVFLSLILILSVTFVSAITVTGKAIESGCTGNLNCGLITDPYICNYYSSVCRWDSNTYDCYGVGNYYSCLEIIDQAVCRGDFGCSWGGSGTTTPSKGVTLGCTGNLNCGLIADKYICDSYSSVCRWDSNTYDCYGVGNYYACTDITDPAICRGDLGCSWGGSGTATPQVITPPTTSTSTCEEEDGGNNPLQFCLASISNSAGQMISSCGDACLDSDSLTECYCKDGAIQKESVKCSLYGAGYTCSQGKCVPGKVVTTSAAKLSDGGVCKSNDDCSSGACGYDVFTANYYKGVTAKSPVMYCHSSKSMCLFYDGAEVGKDCTRAAGWQPNNDGNWVSFLSTCVQSSDGSFVWRNYKPCEGSTPYASALASAQRCDVTCVQCTKNEHCSAGQTCEGNVCKSVTPSCDLTNVRWSTSSSFAGVSVSLISQATNCNGKTIDFKVYQVKSGEDDYIYHYTTSIVSNLISVTTSWAPLAPSNGIANPTYYFIASIVGSSEVETSGNLDVSVPVTTITKKANGAICTSNDQCSSGACDYDIFTANRDVTGKEDIKYCHKSKSNCLFFAGTMEGDSVSATEAPENCVRGAAYQPSNNGNWVNFLSECVRQSDGSHTWENYEACEGSTPYASALAIDKVCGVTCVQCTKNEHCDSGQICENKVCKTVTPNPSIACDLTNARWSTSSTLTGSVVSLIVQGANCNGKTIDFAVYQVESTGNVYITNTATSTFSSSSSVSSNWVAVSPSNGDSTPTYYFVAKVLGSSESDKSGNLDVSVPVTTITKKGNGAICTSNDQCSSGACDYDIFTANSGVTGKNPIKYCHSSKDKCLFFAGIMEGDNEVATEATENCVRAAGYQPSNNGNWVNFLSKCVRKSDGSHTWENYKACTSPTPYASALAIDKVCGVTCVQCTKNEHCGAGQICENKVCKTSTVTPTGPVCGNGIREGTEKCDIEDLGGATCSSVLGSKYVGKLKCTTICTFNPNLCVLAQCTADSDCDAGKTCVNGVCQIISEGPTNPTTPRGGTLANGAICTSNDQCISGACDYDIFTANRDVTGKGDIKYCHKSKSSCLFFAGVIQGDTVAATEASENCVRPAAYQPSNNGNWVNFLSRCVRQSDGSHTWEDYQPCTSPTPYTSSMALAKVCGATCVQCIKNEHCGAGKICENMVCKTATTNPSTTCGDGKKETGEDCDDYNKINGDGCSSSCGVESGYTCTKVLGQKSVCQIISGGPTNPTTPRGGTLVNGKVCTSNEQCISGACDYDIFTANRDITGKGDVKYCHSSKDKCLFFVGTIEGDNVAATEATENCVRGAGYQPSNNGNWVNFLSECVEQEDGSHTWENYKACTSPTPYASALAIEKVCGVTCVQCKTNSHCKVLNKGTPICDTTSNTCVQCLSNSQCTSPYICEGGRCVESVACDVDEDCLSEQKCNVATGKCYTPTPISKCGNGICDNNLGETCTTCSTDCGNCIERCELNSDCDSGYKCSSTGTCVKIEMACQPGYESIDGVCIREACIGITCNPGYECWEGGECVPIEEVECLGNYECDTGYICSDGFCVEKVPCEDGDNGKNYYTYGTITGSNKYGEGNIEGDYCWDSGKGVMEGYCTPDGYANFYSYACPSGFCKDGACVKASSGGVCELGCSFNGKCRAYGYRKLGQYCSSDHTFVNQLANNQACVKSYECRSNVCLRGKCVSKSSTLFRNFFGRR